MEHLIEQGGLVEMTMMPAHKVTRIGIQDMFSRKRSVTPGIINWINEALIKFLPRGVGIAIAGWVVRP
ncbi:MAG: hypothetical protein SH857_17570 [Chitinophagales bacterium]|nr:hypothetical protein [Chitinophagales bacterium]